MPATTLSTKPAQRWKAAQVNDSDQIVSSRKGSFNPTPSQQAGEQSANHQEPRLDSLTSLRFFAAMMILTLHLSQLFGFNSHTCLDGLALWQGVSFFFVLSGFILAYVYPKIETPSQSNQFILARFARIWPTHLASFLLTIALVPSVLHIANVIPIAIANLCMVQVWAFNPAISESFNSVSWTISIELFFYLCFPFLIKDFFAPSKKRWVAAAVLSSAAILLCATPFFFGFSGGALPTALYMGENPLCRLFEFTLGIAVCWLFKNHPLPKSVGRAGATILEVAALCAIAAAISLSNLWPAQNALGAWSVMRAWAIDMGGAPAYGALILLIASERGYIAQLLKKKTLVRLGEISFSLYMYHLSILYVLVNFQSSFANLPGFILPAIGVLTCLIASHLNFTLVETPARKAIMNFAKKLNKQAGASEAPGLDFDSLIFSPPVPRKSRQKAFAAPSLWLDDLVFSPPFPDSGLSVARSWEKVLAHKVSWIDDLVFSPPFPGSVAKVQQATAGVFARESLWLDDLTFTPPYPGKTRKMAHSLAHAEKASAHQKADNQLKPVWSVTSVNDKSRQIYASIVAELAALVLIAFWLNTQFRFIPPIVAQRIESHSLPTARDIEFGGRFKLRGLKLSRKADGVFLNAVWESIGPQRLRYVNAIHVIDANGKTLSTRIYPQDTFNRSVAAGKIWEDKICLPPDQLKNALRLGLSLYDPPDGMPLRANKGITDGGNVRLLVAIPTMPTMPSSPSPSSPSSH